MTCPEGKKLINCAISINLFPIAHDQESGKISNIIQIDFKACSHDSGFIDFASYSFFCKNFVVLKL